MNMTADQLGQEAYNKIIVEHFRDAVVILSRAIDLAPEDGRLYSNRCYCYLELNELDRAKRDAVTLKEKFPDEKNGYILLGEVLLAQRKCREAEEEFHRAYIRYPDQDTADRLFEAQMHQILDRGYDPILARTALLYERHVQGALSLLAMKQVPPGNSVQGSMTFSTSEEQHLMRELRHAGMPVLIKKCSAEPKVLIRKPGSAPKKNNDPLLDPSNPLKVSSLWVGYLTDAATEPRLKKLFAKVGNLISVCCYGHHAFVNFTDYQSAGKAMEMFQGFLFDGQKLLLKFPDKYRTEKK